MDKIHLDLEFGVNAYKGVKDARSDAKIGEGKGCYLTTKPGSPQIFLISIASGIIRNERLSFTTKSGEVLNLKLNCRENLTTSTKPSRLHLKLPTDENDVGDVAVVKFDTSPVELRKPIYSAVCEGLILSKFSITHLVVLCLEMGKIVKLLLSSEKNVCNVV